MTYNFDAVARSGGECPGAGLLAGVFIRPIGAGDDTTDTIHSVITASCIKTSLSQCRPLYHANMEQIPTVSMCSSTLMAAVTIKNKAGTRINVQPYQRDEILR